MATQGGGAAAGGGSQQVFKEGLRVMYLYNMDNSQTAWFSGYITKHYSGHMYMVRFEDGETAKLAFQSTKQNVTWKLVQVAVSAAVVGAASLKRKPVTSSEEVERKKKQKESVQQAAAEVGESTSRQYNPSNREARMLMR